MYHVLARIGHGDEFVFEIAIAAFAARTTLHDLAANVELTRTALDRMPDSDLVQAANRVLEALDANLAALAPYNITAETRSELAAAITAYAQKKATSSPAKKPRRGDATK